MVNEKYLEKETFDYFITKLMEYPNNDFFNHMIKDIKHTIQFKDLQQNQEEDELIYIYGGSASDVI